MPSCATLAADGPALDYTPAMLASAVALADRHAVSDIETGSDIHIDSLGQRWYDVSCMVDLRELPPQSVDMNLESLGWAVARRLVMQHPIKPYLLRIGRP